ncbi:MAG TPA: DUF4301 family protein [Acidobacteriota bacterium]|nr:DUF4301 family protein [Acidobacteriota bacterium]
MSDSGNFMKADLKQLRLRGLDTQTALDQLRTIKEASKPQRLLRSCTQGYGIHSFPRSEVDKLSREFEKPMADGRAMKFVTASGAATRMFSLYSSLLEKGRTDRQGLLKAAKSGDEEAREFLDFIQALPHFAFFEELKKGTSFQLLTPEGSPAISDFREPLQYLLGKEGLGFGAMPKGMIPFHSYPEGARTALEEHLIEALGYLKDRSGKVRVHFTLSPHYLSLVQEHIKKACKRFEGAYQAQFEVVLSTQDPATDTLVLDDQFQPLRDDRGSLVFRPGGHGALLGNLDALGGDIVFVKTIDNVLPERFTATVCLYKTALGGLLVRLQEQMFRFLEQLSTGSSNPKLICAIEEFLETMFFSTLPKKASLREKAAALRALLDRPLRVCGVVKHQGEPGGKPCWVADSEGSASLQLVESTEVDLNRPDQRQIWEASEYFNPVDIVCGLRDFRGGQFELFQYRDASASFVTTKYHDGKELRVLELPGLWNGSMAFWNTVFVEVPRITFHPVKTVMDLLGDAHRS